MYEVMSLIKIEYMRKGIFLMLALLCVTVVCNAAIGAPASDYWQGYADWWRHLWN